MRWIVLFVLALVGCGGPQGGGQPTPQPGSVSMDPTGAAQMMGVWNGTFENKAIGTKGYLWFRFFPATALQRAQVVIRPAKAGSGEAPRGLSQAPTVLDMTFVSVNGHTFLGVVPSYYDPACNCVRKVTFRGTIHGNDMQGTFLTQSGAGSEQLVGTWYVHRR